MHLSCWEMVMVFYQIWFWLSWKLQKLVAELQRTEIFRRKRNIRWSL
jgi:hypothetical protein